MEPQLIDLPDDSSGCTVSGCGDEEVTVAGAAGASQQPSQLDKRSDGGPASGVFAKLTKDQLIEYSKKQKKEIKKLRADLAEAQRTSSAAPSPVPPQELAVSSRANSFEEFWEAPGRPTWQRRLARVALRVLVARTPALSRLAREALRAAFYRWSALSSAHNLCTASDALKENKMVTVHLEQRVSKLKALLAKLHQSKQKSAQDLNSTRQRQQVQEQEQTLQLQERLRLMTVESAFQSDMELAIERAASQLSLSTRQTSGASLHADAAEATQRIQELEQGLADARREKLEQDGEVSALREQVGALVDDVAVKEKELQLLRRRDREAREHGAALERRVAEQEAVRRELELELRVLVARRADVAAQVEAAASKKASQLVKKMQAQLKQGQEEVKKVERRAAASEKSQERMGRELVALRKSSKDLAQIRAENDRLSLLLHEMKRSSLLPTPVTATTSDNTELQRSSSQVVLEKRVLKYLLRALDKERMRALSSQVFKVQQICSAYDSHMTSSSSVLVKRAGHSSCNSFTLAWSTFVLRELDAALGLGSARRLQHAAGPTSGSGDSIMQDLAEAASACGAMEDAEQNSAVVMYNSATLLLQELEAEAANWPVQNSIGSSSPDQPPKPRPHFMPPVSPPPAQEQVDVFSWKASEVSLQAGRAIDLPIPAPRPEQRGHSAVLRWELRGSHLDSLKLSLSPLEGTPASSPPTALRSALTLATRFDRGDSGSSVGAFVLHGMAALQTEHDQLLTITNSASWVTASISYVVKLCATPPGADSITAGNETQNDALATSSATAPASSSASTYNTAVAHRVKLEDRISSLAALKSRLHEVLRRGIELRRVFLSRREAWQAATVAFHELCRARDDETLAGGGVSGPAGELGARMMDISCQFEQFCRSADVIEEYVFAPPGTPRNKRPLTSLLELPPEPQAHQEEEGGQCSMGGWPPLPRPLPTPRVVFSAAELRISASQDFRCPLLTPLRGDVQGCYLISWDFQLLPCAAAPPSPLHAPKTPSSEDSTGSALDVGFCVLGKKPDGSFYQLESYRRVNCGRSVGEAGSLRYRVTPADETQSPPRPDTAKEVCAPFEEVVVLFDNTYSWITPKLLRYEISLEFLADEPCDVPAGGSLINVESVPPAHERNSSTACAHNGNYSTLTDVTSDDADDDGMDNSTHSNNCDEYDSRAERGAGSSSKVLALMKPASDSPPDKEALARAAAAVVDSAEGVLRTADEVAQFYRQVSRLSVTAHATESLCQTHQLL